LAEVGIESTLAGNAFCLFSETSAAAVTCGIMKPELRPGLAVRNAGRPDNAGSTSMAMRRSAETAQALHATKNAACLVVQRRTWRGGEMITHVRTIFQGALYRLQRSLHADERLTPSGVALHRRGCAA
jgi:hypothetical protein